VYLLRLLKTFDGHPFIFMGKHSTITACSLPEWLPEDILAKMIEEFGGRLRCELVKLKQHTEIVKNRTLSTDSGQISIDSLDSYRDPYYEMTDDK
jgi:hypothetical protein